MRVRSSAAPAGAHARPPARAPEGCSSSSAMRCAAVANPVADHPRPSPDERPEEERDGRELASARRCAPAWTAKRRSRRAPSATSGARPLGTQGEEVQSDGRPERGPGRVAEAVQRCARRGGQCEDRERRSAARDERAARRTRRAARRADPGRACPARRRARRAVASERANTTAAMPASSRNAAAQCGAVRLGRGLGRHLPGERSERPAGESRGRIPRPPWGDAKFLPGGVSERGDRRLP